MRAGRYVDIAEVELVLGECEKFVDDSVWVDSSFPSGARKVVRKAMRQALDYVRAGVGCLDTYDGVLERADTDHTHTIW